MESLRNALYWISRLYEHLACASLLAANVQAATHGMVHTDALHGEIFCRRPVFVNDNAGNAAGPGTAMYLYRHNMYLPRLMASVGPHRGIIAHRECDALRIALPRYFRISRTLRRLQRPCVGCEKGIAPGIGNAVECKHDFCNIAARHRDRTFRIHHQSGTPSRFCTDGGVEPPFFNADTVKPSTMAATPLPSAAKSLLAIIVSALAAAAIHAAVRHKTNFFISKGVKQKRRNQAWVAPLFISNKSVIT